MVFGKHTVYCALRQCYLLAKVLTVMVSALGIGEKKTLKSEVILSLSRCTSVEVPHSDPS